MTAVEAARIGVQNVSVSRIHDYKDHLRGVQRETEAYAGLVDSIKEHGLLNPIVVMIDEDGENYLLVDGTQRFSAVCDLDWETVPANVVETRAEADLLRKQIIGNIHRIEMKPVQYSKQLQKILALDPLLTATQLASQLAKSTAWINQRLGLLHLDARVAELVDSGKINLTNAYSLSKLPPEEQVAFLDQAMTETPDEFVPKGHNGRRSSIKLVVRVDQLQMNSSRIPDSERRLRLKVNWLIQVWVQFCVSKRV